MRMNKRWTLPRLGISVMISPMLKTTCMNLFFVALARVAVASSVEVGVVPAPVYADLEASAAGAMPLPGLADTLFKLSLTFDSAPTNNVEVALGSGAQGDPYGTGVVVGWDSGEWFIRGDKLRKRLAVPAHKPTVSGARTLTVLTRLGKGWATDGQPISVTVSERLGSEGAHPVDFGMAKTSAVLRAWFDPRGWEAVRVVSRNQADTSATASAAVFYPDGSLMILR